MGMNGMGPSGLQVGQQFQWQQMAQRQQNMQMQQMQMQRLQWQQMMQSQQNMAQIAGRIDQAAQAAMASDPELTPIITEIRNEYQRALRNGEVINPDTIRRRVHARLDRDERFGGAEYIDHAWDTFHTHANSIAASGQSQGGGGWNLGNWIGMIGGGLLGFSLMGGMSGGGFSMTSIIGALLGGVLMSWVGGRAQNWITGSGSSSTPGVALRPAVGEGQGQGQGQGQEQNVNFDPFSNPNPNQGLPLAGGPNPGGPPVPDR
jgi:hypothetical protein